MGISHLYTKQLSQEIRRIKRPFEFSLDVVAYDDFVTLRVREEEIMSMNDTKQLQVMDYLQKVRALVESHGIRCELEGLRYRGK